MEELGTAGLILSTLIALSVSKKMPDFSRLSIGECVSKVKHCLQKLVEDFVLNTLIFCLLAKRSFES